MKNYIKCSDGKQRAAIETTCVQCKRLFLTERRRPAKTCCIKCRTEFKKEKTRVKLKCAYCLNNFERIKSKINNTKSKLNFCCRKCKDKAQSIKSGFIEMQPSHYGTGTIDYRNLFDKNELVCKRCGYNEFTSSVDIHHIDKNRNNNDKSNLVPLCSNCHKALHHNQWSINDI